MTAPEISVTIPVREATSCAFARLGIATKTQNTVKIAAIRERRRAEIVDMKFSCCDITGLRLRALSGEADASWVRRLANSVLFRDKGKVLVQSAHFQEKYAARLRLCTLRLSQ